MMYLEIKNKNKTKYNNKTNNNNKTKRKQKLWSISSKLILLFILSDFKEKTFPSIISIVVFNVIFWYHGHALFYS